MADVITLSRLRADVARSGSARARELMNAPDPAAAVQALDPVELYSLASDLGEGDAMALVDMATREQVQRMVDIGGWRKDEPNLTYLDRWFQAAFAQGPGTATRLFDKLDEELQTLYLARRFIVHDARDEDSDRGENERYLTPDGTFIIEIREDQEEAANNAVPGYTPFQLVADLYYTDWRRADTIFRDTKWTIVSELEDDAVRYRRGRLEELGFPSLDEAMRVFSRMASHEKLELRARPKGERRHLPARYAEPFLGEGFLAAVLSRLTDDALLGEVEGELMLLANAELVAHGSEIADLEAVIGAAREVRNHLSLGLELHSNGEVEAAFSSIERHPLRAFVRLAMTQVYKLRDWAQKAEREGLFHLPGIERPLLAGHDAAFLAALTRRLPRYAPDLGVARAFASRDELHQAQRRLESMAKRMIAIKWLLGGRLDVTAAFAGCTPRPDEIGSRTLLRSLLVRRAIGASPLATVGVSEADVRAFAAKCASGAWPSDLGEEPPEIADVLVEEWQKLTREVAAAGGDPDPRFLDFVLLVRGSAASTAPDPKPGTHEDSQ